MLPYRRTGGNSPPLHLVAPRPSFLTSVSLEMSLATRAARRRRLGAVVALDPGSPTPTIAAGVVLGHFFFVLVAPPFFVRADLLGVLQPVPAHTRQLLSPVARVVRPGLHPSMNPRLCTSSRSRRVARSSRSNTRPVSAPRTSSRGSSCTRSESAGTSVRRQSPRRSRCRRATRSRSTSGASGVRASPRCDRTRRSPRSAPRPP